MIIDRDMLTVATLAENAPAVAGTQVALASVKVEADGSMVATNGHVLAVVRPSRGCKDKDFPQVPGMPELPKKAPALEPFTVPAESLLALQKAIPRKGNMPILKTACLIESETNENGHAVFATSDLETGQLHNLRKSECTFPAYEKVIPAAEPTFRVAFNWHLLAKLGRVADAVSSRTSRDAGGLILEFTDADKPITVKIRDGASDRFLGVLMPMQLPGDSD